MAIDLDLDLDHVLVASRDRIAVMASLNGDADKIRDQRRRAGLPSR